MNPEQILTEADRCVKCGLCLPHCPTYRLNRDEGDSPRGRIALAQALAGGAVDSPRLHRHLDLCLNCRACESACPSGVRYGALIDGVRGLQRQHRRGIAAWLLDLIAHLPYRRGSTTLLRVYQRSGMQGLTRLSPSKRIRRLGNLLPTLAPTPSWREIYRPNGKTLGRVGLFTGCVGRITDRPALDASIRVLNQLGLEVVVPRDQVCCGALHLHNGAPGPARTLAAANRKAFGAAGVDKIVYLASGCGAQLIDYETLGGALRPDAVDISRYLNEFPGLGELELSPLGRKILVHTPCTQRHTIRQPDQAIPLLRRIPGIDLQTLPDKGCCGAAGSYLLSQPAMADQLRRETLEAAEFGGVDMLMTSNTGCALHLAAGLRQRGSPVEVLHPVELIARQLRT